MSTLAEIRNLPTCVTTLEGGRPVHESVLKGWNILQWVKDQLQTAESQFVSPSLLLEVIDLLEQKPAEPVVKVEDLSLFERKVSLRELYGVKKNVEDVLKFMKSQAHVPEHADKLDAVLKTVGTMMNDDERS